MSERSTTPDRSRSMREVYHWIAENPGSAIGRFLASVLVLAVLPWFVWGSTVYAGTDWPRTLALFATLVLAVVGGMIPVAQWLDAQDERRKQSVQDIIDRKPLVVTNVSNEQHEVRNIGSAVAINVWLLPESGKGVPLSLGSLDVHEARTLDEPLLSKPHVLIAEARPSGFIAKELRRPFTVTFNVMAGDSGVRHGFDRNPPDERLARGGTINDYLAAERIGLVNALRAFIADAPAQWSGDLDADRHALDAIPAEAAEVGLASDMVESGSLRRIEDLDTFRLKGP